MHFLHAVERMAFDVYTIYIRQWHPSDRHPPMMSVKKICVHTKYKTLLQDQVCNGYNLKTISIDVENVPFESPTKFRQVLILVNEPLQIDNSIYCENVDIH